MKEKEIYDVLQILHKTVQKAELIENKQKDDLFSALRRIAEGFKRKADTESLVAVELAEFLYPLVEKVGHIVEIEREKRKKEKQRFNVFNCLTRHHLEELHSRFLVYLLNPRESHDCGSLFLGLFIDTLKCEPEISNVLKRHELLLPSATVIREKFIGWSADSDVYGRIDIFIETKYLDIVIENKVRAREQPDQIERYINYCKENGREYLALYLTLDGHESTQDGGEKYFCISYSRHINEWLDKCLWNVKEIPLVFSGITFYKNLLNDHILHKPVNEVIMKIKSLFRKSENIHILKYSKEILDALSEIHNDLRRDFLLEVLKQTKQKYKVNVVNKITIPLDSDKIWEKSYSGFVLQDSDLVYEANANDKLYVCFEHDGTNLYYGLFGLKIKGESKCGSDFSKTSWGIKIEASMQRKFQNQLEDFDRNWFLWKFFTFDEEDHDFSSYELDYLFATEMDALVERFFIEFEAYLKAWRETIIEIAKKR